MGEKAAKDERGLTHRQRLFIEAYLGSANGSLKASAIAAGYSERTAREKGYQVFHSPEVQAEIQRRYAEVAMSANEVLYRLAEQARNRGAEFLAVDGKGRATIDLQAVKEAGLIHLVKSVRISPGGRQVIELYDAQAALVQIGRHHKLFTDKLEADVTGLDNAIERALEELAGRREAGDAGETPEPAAR